MLLRSSKVSFPFIWYASTVLYGTWPASVKLQSTSTRSSSSSSSIFVSSFLPTTALSRTRSKYQQLGITTAATGKSRFAVVGCNQRTPNLISAISTARSRRMASSSAASDDDTDFLKEKLSISVEDAIKLHGKSNVKFIDG